ncbi:MAG: pantetheine-phosphate adenylyltransferase [Candidatus Margulisiibacteriota bacterium]
MKIAVYPGSFDPITNGHIDIIERAARMFGLLYVAVIKNPDKESCFSFNERLDMLKGAVPHIKNVKIDSFDGLLVDYAEKKNAMGVVRGLRAVSDFDYEFQMALTNRKLNADIETVFLMTDSKYSYLSSSLIRQIVVLGGNVAGMVPKNVEKILKSRRV